MRYFFNLVDANASIPDTEGIEVGSMEELRAEVATAIAQARDANPSAAREWKGWRLEVTDGSGAVLLTIGLDDLRPGIVLSSPLGAFVLVKGCELSEHLANVIPDQLPVFSI